MTKDSIDDAGIFLAVECSLCNIFSRFLINMPSKKRNGRNLLKNTLISYCSPIKIVLD